MPGMESAFAASSLCVPVRGGLFHERQVTPLRRAVLASRSVKARSCRALVAVAAAEDSVDVSNGASGKRVEIVDILPTPGGWIVDCEVTKFDKVTKYVTCPRLFVVMEWSDAACSLACDSVLLFFEFRGFGADIRPFGLFFDL